VATTPPPTMASLRGTLAAVEPFASELAATALRAAGVDLRLDTEPTRITRDVTGEVQLALADGTFVSADEVLVATGRTANTATIGMQNIGLTPGDWLTVDDALQVVGVAGGWLYAAGDVNRRLLLTHQGKYQARMLGDSIVARANGTALDQAAWGRHALTADDRAVPQVIFGDPEIATVGYTVAEATRRGLNVRAVEYDLGAVAGAALHADGYTGRAVMVVDEDRKVVVGFTMAGADVAELLHAATIAIAGEVPLDRLWHAVPAYPTVSEVWLRLLETYGRDS
jgi:pyruvate/2-oxoglutarate dehydrogenase complex dihydrolipoamide dehydrogenase (E3) component